MDHKAVVVISRYGVDWFSVLFHPGFGIIPSFLNIFLQRKVRGTLSHSNNTSVPSSTHRTNKFEKTFWGTLRYPNAYASTFLDLRRWWGFYNHRATCDGQMLSFVALERIVCYTLKSKHLHPKLVKIAAITPTELATWRGRWKWCPSLLALKNMCADDQAYVRCCRHIPIMVFARESLFSPSQFSSLPFLCCCVTNPLLWIKTSQCRLFRRHSPS